MFNNLKLTSVFILMSVITNAYVINYNSLSNMNGVYNYHRAIGVPLAEEIKKYESEISMQRITGGLETEIDVVPYQAGLIVSVFGSHSVCGGSIILNTRVLTAAHCYFDGISTAQAITVVLGSNLLFFGGTRIDAEDIVAHSGFNPITIENDIAVIRVPKVESTILRTDLTALFIHLTTALYATSCQISPRNCGFYLSVVFSSQIQPVALPSSEVNMDFTGYEAIASGYGMTNDDDEIGLLQTVSSVTIPVISNTECAVVYGGYILDQHLCTSGVGAKGTCGGDSGGPLVVYIDSRTVLIGITSFGAEFCTESYPSAYVRVTEFLDWISKQMTDVPGHSWTPLFKLII